MLRYTAQVAQAYDGVAIPAHSAAKKTDTFADESEQHALQAALDSNSVPTGTLLEKLKRYMIFTQVIEQAQQGKILLGGERLLVAKPGGWPSAYTAAMIVTPAMNYVANNCTKQHDATWKYIYKEAKKLAHFVFKPKNIKK